MIRSAFIFGLPVLFAAVIGPVSVALGTVAQTDASDVYLLVGSQRTLERVLAQPEAREIGPNRAPFAAMMHMSSELHASLARDGYWIFPATPLADLCGIAFEP